jgi:hypothetical protein
MLRTSAGSHTEQVPLPPNTNTPCCQLDPVVDFAGR